MSVKSFCKPAFLNSTCIICTLSLFFIAWCIPAAAIQKKHVAAKKGVVNTMIVISIAPPENERPYFTVIFRVSQRAYKLPNDANPRYLKLLKESEKNHTPLLVRRAREESDVIVSVEKP